MDQNSLKHSNNYNNVYLNYTNECIFDRFVLNTACNEMFVTFYVS